MGVIEPINSNPNTKGKSRDVLISQLYLHFGMEYKGNNSQNRIEKAFEIFIKIKCIYLATILTMQEWREVTVVSTKLYLVETPAHVQTNNTI